MIRALVVYDLWFRDTEKIARTIADTLDDHEARVSRASDVTLSDLTNLDMLIVGSAAHKEGMLGEIKGFVDSIPEGTLNGIWAAAFDVAHDKKFSGSAANKIEKGLRAAGAIIIGKDERFLVSGAEGIVPDDQLDRATSWAADLILAASSIV